MLKVNDEVKCPECGTARVLETKPGDESKMIAYCDCGRQHMRRAVYQTDNPEFLTFQQIVEPGEPPSPAARPKKGRFS